MAKYSYEFKKQVDQFYLNGEGGTPYLAKKYNISSAKDIQKWIGAYKTFGNDGLLCSRNGMFAMASSPNIREPAILSFSAVFVCANSHIM